MFIGYIVGFENFRSRKRNESYCRLRALKNFSARAPSLEVQKEGSL